MNKILYAIVFYILSSVYLFSQTALDYDVWMQTAQRAEKVVETDRASVETLEVLRGQLVIWRQSFQQEYEQNSQRIRSINEQMVALGAVPEVGEDPLEERRFELNQQLMRYTAPAIRAQEAFNRADGIIGKIDNVIVRRQTLNLMVLGPSPLNPVHWSTAVAQITDALTSIIDETIGVFGSAGFASNFEQNWMRTFLLVGVSIVLIIIARPISNWAAGIITLSDRFVSVSEFFASLFTHIIRFFAVYLLFVVCQVLDIFGIRGAVLFGTDGSFLQANLLWWAGYILAANWLTERFWLAPNSVFAPYENTMGERLKRLAILSAIVLVLRDVLDVFVQLQLLSDISFAVCISVVMILASLCLWSFSRAGQDISELSNSETHGPTIQINIIRALRRLLSIIAIFAPILACIGFINGAIALIFPMMISLALLALIAIMQKLVSDTYNAILRRSDAQNDALIPVLLGFLLTLAGLPLLALIWGMRVASLTELWTTFQEGLQIGESRISPWDFMAFVLIFTIGYMLTRLFQSALRGTILPKTKMDLGAQNAVVSGIGYVGIFIAALIAISGTGLDLSSIAIVAGALSVGIGFGLQTVVSNFVSGIILLIERPISQGDWIEVGGQMGYVRNISVRSTRIETFDRTDVIVPNADLVSGVVTNWTRGNKIGRVIIPIGVAYGSDTKQVEAILLDIIKEQDYVALNPEPSVVLQGFGADSLNFEIRAILTDVNYILTVKSAVNHEIVRRFGEEGIEIPFAQRDIWIRNPEALKTE